MIPARFAPVAFGFFLSSLMSFIVSGLSTFRSVGFTEGVFGIWMGNWAFSWGLAFPVVLIVAPIAQRLVAKITRPD
ncbi:MAG: DUF2798 domain-containing protein [Pseudomonadota bacterium]